MPPSEAPSETTPRCRPSTTSSSARAAALHRLEGLWRNNVHTPAGSLDHSRVHAARDNDEGPFRTPAASGSSAIACASSASRTSSNSCPTTPAAPTRPSPSNTSAANATLGQRRGPTLRQAVCLEEMLGVAVPAGAVFHTLSKRRRDVVFDQPCARTADTAARLHALLASGATPPPVVHPKCKQCSVRGLCLPDLIASRVRYRRAAGELSTVPAIP